MSEPSKVNGQINSALGSTKEAIGNLTGATSWTQAGQEQHAKGEAEIKAAQAKQYADGVSNQVQGKVDNVIGSITGDKTKQASGAAQEQAGKAQKETA
ncbi:hypothetical protein OC834_003599 [Tilletia horrida]|nr:hypothetical protein OC834_003599 [Tilletia horrida]KAK0531129.1 hypothetical protein OC835_003781 [Tilletia horrida]KAK0560836.1 hypothetical protein OC844_003533 [Tilletia horrida]